MSSKRLFTPLARHFHRRSLSTIQLNNIFDFDAPTRPLHHRVVVTGLGLVTPFGVGVAQTWENLLAGASSIRALEPSHLPSEHADAFDSLPSKVVGKVDHRHIGDILDAKQLPGVDSKSPSFVQFACLAASEAFKDAGWLPETEKEREETGVSIGAGMSSTYDLAHAGALLHQRKIRRISPFFVPRILVNSAAGAVSMAFSLHGPNHATSTACATGAHAVGDAFKMIQRGDATVMLAGGTESCVDAIALSGFSRMKALSTRYNDIPSSASRPFDVQRDGFVLSEGAGVLVLENAGHAISRGARIYCEILGYGMSGDAYHITKPREDGYGARLAMQRALDMSGVQPQSVAYINAHATSTPIGDATELQAIHKLFIGEHKCNHDVYVSSSKGALGHLLGAAGSVEAAISCLTAFHRRAPPNVNLEQTDIELQNQSGNLCGRLRLVPADEPIELRGPGQDLPMAVMSNSFGFGGTNTSLLFGSMSPE